MVNNVRNNTISEIDARKDLNTLDKIKNAEIIKYKKCTPGHKELLNSLDNLLDMILTDITLESESQENENEKVEIKKEEHEDYENEYEDDDETMSQNEIKEKKDYLDKIIDKSKPFKDQIKSFKKVENLKGYWRFKKFGDKKLKFKLKVAHLSKIIDEKLFEQIFGHTFIKLANKLINTTNKEENQIIVKIINENKEKLYEMDPFYNFVIQPSDWRINLIDAIGLILDFNKTI